jgi:peptide/nickel transport system substrate-binding protein
MGRRPSQVFGILVAAAVLAACEGPPARPKPWRHAPEPTAAAANDTSAAARLRERADVEEERRRTLRIRLEADPAHLDPLLDPDVEGRRAVVGTVFEPLLVHDGDGADGVAPALAESYRVVDGGTEVRLTIRAGVTFHDGRPVTAADAQFSLDRARGGASRVPHLRRALAGVASVDVWGPRDLRVRLRRPDGYFLRTLVDVPILPAALYEVGDLAHNPHNRAPVGTGPYRFVKWTRGDRIVLARNDAYWGARPAFDHVELAIVPDGARALALARQGELDLVPSLIPEHWPAEATAPATARTMGLLRLAPAWLRFGAFNCRRAPFDDVRVRRAAALAIDRDKLARDVYRGLARPVAGPIFPGGPGDAPAPPPPTDPAIAAAVLEEAGWHVAGGDGVRDKDGQKLRVVLLAGGDARADAERDLAIAGLRRAGFWVELRSGERGALVARVAAGDFDLALVDYRGRTDEDLTPLLGSAGELNPGKCGSSAMDAALAAAAARDTPAARRSAVVEIARLAGEEQPILPLLAADPVGLIARRLARAAPWDGWLPVGALTPSAPASPR